MRYKTYKFLFAALGIAAFLLTLSGCSTPRERAGYSAIPLNAEEPGESRSFGGDF